MLNIVTQHRSTGALSPVSVAFVGSVILSAIALSNGMINPDGILYADAATVFMNEGLSAALKIFSWPLLSVLMGFLAKLTGLPPEWCGNALNVVFMGGACALMVSIIRRNDERLAWLAAIVVLAMPGLNGYRDNLIREYGCWFFMLLAFRLTLDWPEKPGWPRCLAIQGALLVSALFRPEALAFYLAIVLWQHFKSAPEQRWRNSLMLGALPAIALLLLIAAYFGGALGESSRLTNEFRRFDFLAGFDATARNMSQAFNVYARDSAKTAHVILFFGSLALIPWKFLGMIGVFMIPLIFSLVTPGWGRRWRQHGLLIWAFGIYLLILAVFVLQQQFISGRYFGPMILFSLPLVLYGLRDLLQRLPRLYWPTMALCLLLALNNVVSLNPGKEHLREAGQWLRSQYIENQRIYMGNVRIAHYAGWKHPANIRFLTREELAEHIDQYDLVLLPVSRKDPDIAPWAAKTGCHEVRRFTDSRGDVVIACVPEGHSLPPPTVFSKNGDE